jgi:hypothetical protein
MTHLTPDELIDAVEGMLSAERQAHLAACTECRRQLDDLSSALIDAKHVSVPEPSPLFWNHFSERVRTAIDAAPQESGRLAWLRWPALLPLGAVALLVLALVFAVPKSAPDTTADQDLVTAAPQESADEWATLASLVGELDIETASAAVVLEPGIAEQAVLHLTSEEQQELTRLLQAELTRAKS